jgi:hypothetical protein
VYHDLFRRVKQTGMVCQLQEAHAFCAEPQQRRVVLQALMVIQALLVLLVHVLAQVLRKVLQSCLAVIVFFYWRNVNVNGCAHWAMRKVNDVVEKRADAYRLLKAHVYLLEIPLHLPFHPPFHPLHPRLHLRDESMNVFYWKIVNAMIPLIYQSIRH